MDAPKQAIRNDKSKEHGKDDLRQGKNEGKDGRYEGGRDSDQPRQAERHGEAGGKDKVPAPEPMPGHERPSGEEE